METHYVAELRFSTSSPLTSIELDLIVAMLEKRQAAPIGIESVTIKEEKK